MLGNVYKQNTKRSFNMDGGSFIKDGYGSWDVTTAELC
tara:strand:+ start:225 stop:338 length:114 start_codon:yes stop_codon:yes gene_type:complete